MNEVMFLFSVILTVACFSSMRLVYRLGLRDGKQQAKEDPLFWELKDWREKVKKEEKLLEEEYDRQYDIQVSTKGETREAWYEYFRKN